MDEVAGKSYLNSKTTLVRSLSRNMGVAWNVFWECCKLAILKNLMRSFIKLILMIRKSQFRLGYSLICHNCYFLIKKACTDSAKCIADIARAAHVRGCKMEIGKNTSKLPFLQIVKRRLIFFHTCLGPNCK